MGSHLAHRLGLVATPLAMVRPLVVALGTQPCHMGMALQLAQMAVALALAFRIPCYCMDLACALVVALGTQPHYMAVACWLALMAGLALGLGMALPRLALE